MTILLNGHGILAFRDPYGVRPLCLGARPGGGGAGGGAVGMAASGSGVLGGGSADRGGGSGKMDLAVASESAALTGLGFALRRDVRAGEAVFLDDRTGSVSSRVCASGWQDTRTRDGGEGEAEDVELEGENMGGKRAFKFKPCLFEYVYMARPDSIIDGVPASYGVSSYLCGVFSPAWDAHVTVSGCYERLFIANSCGFMGFCSGLRGASGDGVKVGRKDIAANLCGRGESGAPDSTSDVLG